MCRRYSSRNRPKKKKTKVYMSLCSVETNQNLIYKGAQTEERSLLKKKRGKKGRRKLGRHRVGKMMIVVLSPLYRTDCFFSNHWCDPRLLFFLLLTMDATGNARSPSGTAICDSLTLTHSLTHIYVCIHIYVDIYISLSPSAEAGALAAMQESAKPVKPSIVSTYQTANAMHTLLHHVKRALFFSFLFLFFFGELYLLPHGWGGKTGDSPGNKQSRVY